MLKCDICGRIESEPYCEGDTCYDDCGTFRIQKTCRDCGRTRALADAKAAVEALDAYCYDCKKKTIKSEDAIAAITALEGE